jgi:hypothetical protein
MFFLLKDTSARKTKATRAIRCVNAGMKKICAKVLAIAFRKEGELS